jgi:inorganic pyrophosphatase/exopolyphosphatase
MKTILITPKINPDLDGVACAYAYARFLNITNPENKYIAGIYGEPQSEAIFLINKFEIKDLIIFNPDIDFDEFIIVDASDIKGMPNVIRPEDVIEVIDHREIHQADKLFLRAKLNIELVGAAATLIYERFKVNDIKPDRNTAVLLYGAIYSNTLNFKSDIVSQRDITAVSELSNNEFDISECLIDEMFKYKTEYINQNLEKVIIEDFKIFEGSLGIAQIEGFDFENLINNKIGDIKRILEKLRMEHALRYIFLNAPDIENGYNYFVVPDNQTKELLGESMGLSFTENGVAQNTKLLLRKQILPLIVNNL